MIDTGHMADAATSWNRYFTPSIVHRDLGLFCLGTGWHDGKPLAITNRSLNCYAAVFIRSGGGTFRCGAQRTATKVNAGEMFWLFPGIPHTYAPGASGWLEHWLLFSGLAARSYETLGFLRRTHPVEPVTSGAVPALFDQLIEVSQSDHPGRQVRVAALAHQLITDPSRRVSHSDVPSESAMVDQLQAAACEPLSLVEHARNMRVTVPTLRSVVRRDAGVTPKEFVLQTRLTRAQELLAATQLPIHQVAHQIGYDDAAYFSRLFTKRIGVSPRTFRRQQARTDPDFSSDAH